LQLLALHCSAVLLLLPPSASNALCCLLLLLLQVPQFLLEDAVLSGSGSACSIIVTQPRRIAAISVADRVAVERGEKGELRGMLLLLFLANRPAYVWCRNVR
jgi:hypothetical protein